MVLFHVFPEYPLPAQEARFTPLAFPRISNPRGWVDRFETYALMLDFLPEKIEIT
jgi:hypothetical protein